MFADEEPAGAAPVVVDGPLTAVPDARLGSSALPARVGVLLLLSALRDVCSGSVFGTVKAGSLVAVESVAIAVDAFADAGFPGTSMSGFK
jgi:hypothetical protein